MTGDLSRYLGALPSLPSESLSGTGTDMSVMKTSLRCQKDFYVKFIKCHLVKMFFVPDKSKE